MWRGWGGGGGGDVECQFEEKAVSPCRFSENAMLT